MGDLTMAADEYFTKNEKETALVCKTEYGLRKPLGDLTMAADEDCSYSECRRCSNIGAEDRLAIIRLREHHLSGQSSE